MTMLILALVVLTLSPLAGQTGAVAAEDADDDGQAQETPEAEQPEEPAQPTEDVPEATEEAEPTEDLPTVTEEAQETEEATGEAGETATGNPSDLTIVKHTCPAGYDPEAAGIDPMTDCAATVNGVNFTLTDDDPGTVDLQTMTGDSIDGAVRFGGMLPSEYTAIETVPAGTAAIFVTDCGGGGGTGPVPVVIDGTLAIEIPDGVDLTCHWFNIPDGPATSAAGTGTGTVRINVHACPRGYDASSHDMYEMAATCHDEAGVVNFSVFEYGGGGYDGGIKATSGGSGPNLVTFTNVPNVKLTIYEEPVAGYTDAVVFCKVETDLGDAVRPTAYAPPEGGFNTIPIEAPGEGNVVWCEWYNLPELEPAADGNTVTIYKWTCAEGTNYDQDFAWYETNCTQYSDDFAFTLTTAAGTTSTTPNTGQYQWTDVPMGPIGIQETIPPEYGSPVVFCGASTTDGAAPPELTAQEYERYDAPTGYVSHEITDPSGYNFYCQWFNIPGGPGEITIYKWTCAEGYDLYAYGADPKNDCTDATNGVTFFLDQPNPADTDLQTDTGDSIEGAVRFGGLKPDTYVVTEEVPADTGSVFVLECDGLRDGMVRPYPLSTGETLTIDLAAGDKVVRHWFNVPTYDADYGRVTVTKYWCSTPTFVSEVDCQIYEEGITFDLLVDGGSGWDVYDTRTTDGASNIIWQNLDPGTYWLDERDQTWRALYSSTMNSGKESFAVNENEETIVKVYNCELDPPSGKQPPTRYPNTGVGPTGSDSDSGSGPVALPSLAPLLGIAVIIPRRLRATSLTRRRRSPEVRGRRGPSLAIVAVVAPLAIGPAIAQDAEDGEDAAATPAVELCLPDSGTPASGSDNGEGDGTGTGSGDSSGDQNEETLVEDDPNIAIATGDASTVDSGGSHNATDACARGDVPARIEIETIGVDAGIEILETVGGEMQQPTDAGVDAWYKESARIGEPGNIVIAGHLNWWNVPEAVFGRISTPRPGDTIVLTGADGVEAQYEVERVTQEDAFAEPAAEEDTGN